MFGFTSSTAPQPAQQAANAPQADDIVFDVGMADFEAKVLNASMQTPILVDFWAPWCGPCKQLMPVLEQAVRAAKGAVRMAKVNIDENPQLAQAFRVQSVPTVIALFQGQPVTGFTGAQPQSQITALIDQLAKIAKQASPEAIDIPAALKDAAQALTEGDIGQAQALYSAVLQQDNNHVEAYVGLVRSFIVAGMLDDAEQMIAHAPELIAKSPLFAPAKTALDLARNAPAGDPAALQAAIAKDPANHQASIDLAKILFAHGRRQDAVAALIASIGLDREWGEQAARKQLLQFFDAMGPSDPDTIAGRKALSRVLFS
jgi:putative thioredoxin